MTSASDYRKIKSLNKKAPEWKWIETNFGIEPSEDIPLAAHLRKDISERIGEALDSMENIIGGGESYSGFFERKMLNEKEKQEIFEIYKRMQGLLWEGRKASITGSDKDLAAWLASVKTLWDGTRPKLVKFFDKISEGWMNYKKPETETQYHG